MDEQKKKNNEDAANLSACIEKEVLQDPLRIEVIAESLSNEDLLEYTNAFLDEFRNMPPMESFSLLTPEDAANAAARFEERRRYMEQRMSALHRLRSLLLQRQARDEKMN